MIGTFQNGLDVLYYHSKFGQIKQRALAVGCENMMFVCLFSCHAVGLQALFLRGGHNLNKYCDTVYGSILMLFTPFSEYPSEVLEIAHFCRQVVQQFSRIFGRKLRKL